MLAVLLVFLIPFGGGIPAGVLLAQARGLSWEVVAGLYAVSDLVLALVFEAVLIGFAALARRRPPMARYGARRSQARAKGVCKSCLFNTISGWMCSASAAISARLNWLSENSGSAATRISTWSRLAAKDLVRNSS